MGRSSQTTTNNREPWREAVPLFRNASGVIQNYLNDPRSREVYGGQRTINMSGDTRQGLHDLANNGGFNQARDHLSRTLNGDFLRPDNSYVQDLQRSVQSSVMPSLNASFARSGMMGSTMHQGTLARAMTDGMAAPMFQNYQNERRMQDGAASALPQLHQANAENRIRAGQMGEMYDRERLQSERELFEERRDADIQALGRVYPYISDMGRQGGTDTSTVTQRANPMERALGYGMMGLGFLGGFPGMGMMGFNGMPNRMGFASPSQRA